MKRAIIVILAGALSSVHGYALGDSSNSTGLRLHLTSSPGLATMGGAQGLTVKAASRLTITQDGMYGPNWAAESFLPTRDLEKFARFRASPILAEKAVRDPQDGPRRAQRH
jgi:hypothetical protein